MIEDDRRPSLSAGNFKTNVAKRQSLYVTHEQGVGRQNPSFEILARDLGNIAYCGFLSGSASRKGYVHIVERDLLQRPLHAVQRYARLQLSRAISASEGHVSELHRNDYRCVNVAERNIANNAGWPRILRSRFRLDRRGCSGSSSLR